MNIFIIAFTNQILTDGVALSFLVITIAFFVRITDSLKSNILLVMTFGLLAGLLPMIRPALFLVSISLYIMFIIVYTYKMCKHEIDVLSLSTIFLSILAFLIPLTIQAVINPQLFDNIRGLGKGQYEFGAYMYKFISIVEPPPAYGYVAYNYPIKQLIDICKASTQSSDCIKQVFTAHPLMALGHYATKIFTLNDQVYLTTYIHNFFTPDRYIWRLINCMFLASSTIGLALAIKKARRNIRKYFFVSLVTLIILTSLMLPLIASIPEERYGIHFHPFFALSTSYLLYSCFGSNQFTLVELSKIPTKILLILFALAFLLFQFSLYIESTFGIRM